jgi:AraC family transcriptional regulator of adaptative response/methylated-DNA-[protein]-cysteine methyltransferase
LRCGYGGAKIGPVAPLRRITMTDTLRYEFVRSHFGECLLALTDRGVCHLEFTDGDRDRALACLAARWPAAKLERRTGLADAQLLFDDDADEPPLDLHGTAFQREVWDALRRIPAGQTLTYGQLARQLGRPNSARAVASAVASNRVAGLVPCHRVVAAGGGLGGFRWGTRRKAAWLARESRLAA